MPTKVASPANAVPPEPWRSFLRALDRQLKDVVALRCLGGFVVTQQYGIGRGTFRLLPVRCRTELLRAQSRPRKQSLHQAVDNCMLQSVLATVAHDVSKRVGDRLRHGRNLPNQHVWI